MKILVVEDDLKVASFITRGLTEQLNHVDTASDGMQGDHMARQGDYDVIILDILLPGQNGIELCRSIRHRDYKVAILMLTALGSTEDKVAGLEAGADDYLVKPFEFRELLARVKVLLKKSNMPVTAGNKLFFDDLILDMDKKIALRSGSVIELTAKEFSLLEYFMRNRGRVLSRNDIAEKVWDAGFDFGTNVVDVYVNFLRKKIDKGFENKLIHTKVGFGYVFGDF